MNDREQVFDSLQLYENINGKEKVSSTEVEEPTGEEKFTFITTASSLERMSPNSEHEIPEAKVNPVRRQSQSGPLTSRTVLSHSASEKGHIFERFDICNCCLRLHFRSACPIYRNFQTIQLVIFLSARSQSEQQTASIVRRAPSFSGPLNLSTRASSNSLSAPIKYSGGEQVTLAVFVQLSGFIASLAVELKSVLSISNRIP